MYTDVQQGNGDDLVAQHAPLLKRIAYHLVSRMPPNRSAGTRSAEHASGNDQ